MMSASITRFLAGVLSLSLLLSSSGLASAKLAQCRTRFTKKMTSDYCTKFGTAQHAQLEFEVRSRVLNNKSLTVDGNKEHFYIEVAAFADQDYERLQAMDSKPTCFEKRQAATQILQTVVPVNGDWSDDYSHTDSKKSGKIFTMNRPRMYYFEVLDCNKDISKAYRTGQIPRLMHEIHMRTDKGSNEFSYEDEGLMTLYTVLFALLGILFALMLRTFVNFYKTSESGCMAPHPVMIVCLSMQIMSIFLQFIHLRVYSGDGNGLLVADVFSKVIQGVSEVGISLLLILLASGWKLRYQDIDFEDGLEIYLPMFVLVLMVQIILVALTFVDVDASHKYHDFAGVQGWCLFGLKTILYAYFGYCIYDSKSQTKKNDQLQYLNSLFVMGSLYLMAVPLSVVISLVYEPYERQYMFTLISETFMFGANATMFYLLASPKSSYRKTSTDDATLPHDM